MLHGPVSAAGHAPGYFLDDAVGRIMVSAIVLFLCYAWIQFLRRNRALRAMVTRRDWQWLGEALPYYLPIYDLLGSHTRANRSLRISNAFSGKVKDSEFIACDCKLGEGKHSTRMTIICSSAPKNPFGVGRWDSSYEVAVTGSWFSITPERPRLLEVALLESIIDNIR